MKCRPIKVDGSLLELTQHGSSDFPVSMDRQDVAHQEHGGVRHWHYEIQIAVVTRGSVIFRTPEGSYRVERGQGFYVNGGVLHEAVPTQTNDGEYICVNFLPSILYGPSDSAIRRNYIEPVLTCEKLQAFALLDEPWHREICTLLLELGKTDEESRYGYEIQMVALLLRIWHLIVANNQEKLERGVSVSFSDRQRIRILQGYISKNYMAQISLADIAAAGHISKSECCRVFQRTQKVTPIGYLTTFRLNQARKLLTYSDLSVSEIAQRVGFESPSYFTERFRKELRCTPSEYRQSQKSEK